MEGTDDNFLTQVIEQSTGRGALLDLTLTNKVGLFRDVKLKSSIGCSDLEIVAFRQRGSRAKRKKKVLDFRRADFGISKICLEKAHGIRPWREEGDRKAG